MEEIIGLPIKGFAPVDAAQVDETRGSAILLVRLNYGRRVIRLRAAMRQKIGDFLVDAWEYHPVLENAVVFVVTSLDGTSEEPLGTRLRLDHPFMFYPAFFEVGKETRVEVLTETLLDTNALFGVNASNLQEVGSNLALRGTLPEEWVVVGYVNKQPAVPQMLIQRERLWRVAMSSTDVFPGVGLVKHSKARSIRKQLIGKLVLSEGQKLPAITLDFGAVSKPDSSVDFVKRLEAGDLGNSLMRNTHREGHRQFVLASVHYWKQQGLDTWAANARQFINDFKVVYASEQRTKRNVAESVEEFLKFHGIPYNETFGNNNYTFHEIAVHKDMHEVAQLIAEAAEKEEEWKRNDPTDDRRTAMAIALANRDVNAAEAVLAQFTRYESIPRDLIFIPGGVTIRHAVEEKNIELLNFFMENAEAGDQADELSGILNLLENDPFRQASFHYVNPLIGKMFERVTTWEERTALIRIFGQRIPEDAIGPLGPLLKRASDPREAHDFFVEAVRLGLRAFGRVISDEPMMKWYIKNGIDFTHQNMDRPSLTYTLLQNLEAMGGPAAFDSYQPVSKHWRYDDTTPLDFVNAIENVEERDVLLDKLARNTTMFSMEHFMDAADGLLADASFQSVFHQNGLNFANMSSDEQWVIVKWIFRLVSDPQLRVRRLKTIVKPGSEHLGELTQERFDQVNEFMEEELTLEEFRMTLTKAYGGFLRQDWVTQGFAVNYFRTAEVYDYAALVFFAANTAFFARMLAVFDFQKIPLPSSITIIPEWPANRRPDRLRATIDRWGQARQGVEDEVRRWIDSGFVLLMQKTIDRSNRNSALFQRIVNAAGDHPLVIDANFYHDMRDPSPNRGVVRWINIQ